jgi:chromosome segregation protein
MQEGARGTLKNIFGTVAGLVTASDKYALAIETALGGSMQDIIVGTEEDGEAAINMLKRRDAGRATFRPVSTVRGRPLDERGLENEPGYEGVALQLVEYDPRYAGIYAYLLGRTVVADTLKSAIAISRKYKSRFRIVTLDGQVMNAGGSMTGGSAAKNTGIISRANELKRLAQQRERLSAALETAERQLSESRRELAAAEYELELVRGELRGVEDSALKLEADQNHYALLLAAARESAENLRAEREALGERIRANNESVVSVRGDIARAEEETAGLSRQAAELTGGQEKLSAERERVAALLSGVRASLASLEAERTAVLSAIGELSSLREDLSGGREQQERDLERLES